MAELEIKKGNPIILTETEEIDISRFQALDRLRKQMHPSIEFIDLDVTHLRFTVNGSRKSTKYPASKADLWNWVLGKLAQMNLKVKEEI